MLVHSFLLSPTFGPLQKRTDGIIIFQEIINIATPHFAGRRSALLHWMVEGNSWFGAFFATHTTVVVVVGFPPLPFSLDVFIINFRN